MGINNQVTWCRVLIANPCLERRLEPPGESLAVWRDGHRLLDLPLEERLQEEEGGRAEAEREDAEDGRGRAAVARAPAVAAASRGLWRTGRGLKYVKLMLISRIVC